MVKTDAREIRPTQIHIGKWISFSEEIQDLLLGQGTGSSHVSSGGERGQRLVRQSMMSPDVSDP